MENLGLNLGYVLLQICMFAIVFITLRAWVYKPILGLLDRRSKAIAQGLEDARVAAEARANAERDADRILAEAQSKASLMVKEATERAELAAHEVRSSAEAEAAKVRDTALQELQNERTRILGDLRSQVATLAIAAAQKILGESLDEHRQRSLLDQFFSGVKAGRVTVLEGNAMSGSHAEVASALPLTPAEQETVKCEILTRIGSEASVAFRVDPSLLGGLVIRVGDKVMDGSVAGQLANLRQRLA
ncbi:MAG: F0F1 ATP synthase subunit B [Anaerolineaceae bacterium]|nr:F0F1 ATP synthase subunit B [Anaerolineaceae bacterium]